MLLPTPALPPPLRPITWQINPWPELKGLSPGIPQVKLNGGGVFLLLFLPFDINFFCGVTIVAYFVTVVVSLPPHLIYAVIADILINLVVFVIYYFSRH